MTPEELEPYVTVHETALVPEIPLHIGNRTIIELWDELQSQDPPFWAYAWPGGQALARWTLDNSNEFRGKNVIDLGAGTGINSIAAAYAGAAFVSAVDIEENSQSLTRLNAEMHNISSAINVTEVIPAFHDYDVLLVGDCFYDFELSNFVVDMAAQAHEFGIPVYIGDSNREYTPMRLCEFLERYNVPDTMMLERRPSKPAWAIRMRPNEAVAG